MQKEDHHLRLRPMTPADIPFGMRLKDAAGWNQTPEDWTNFLEMSPDGCFVAEWDGVPAGTVTTVVHGGLVGWIGMVLVDPGYRRRGIGTYLIASALAVLEARCPVVKLDATPAGREVYLPLGFEDDLPFERRVRRAGAPAVPGPETGVEVSSARLEHLSEIDALDRDAFGASRVATLERWLRVAPEYAFVARTAGDLRGFCLGRHGSRYEQIGPLVALEARAAHALAFTAMEACADKAIAIDTLAMSPSWLETLEQAGFRLERGFMRMRRGAEPHPGVVDWQWAAAGPEVG